MTSTARVLLGFTVVSASFFLSGSFRHVGAQFVEGATKASEQDLREPSSEPAPEEPALQLELTPAGVDVAASPPRTVEGYTLEQMELRVKRAKIGLGASAGVFFTGGMFFGFAAAEGISNSSLSGQDQNPKWVYPLLWTGTALLVGGFAGMVASGVLLRRRKRERDALRHAHYGKSRRVQWDLARSRLVF